MIDMITNKMSTEDFEKNYKDAVAFHRRAEQFSSEGQAESVVFNVASIALERYLVALCNFYGIVPENHNYNCLVDTAEIIVDFPEELNQEIRSLDSIFDICSLENHHYKIISVQDSIKILSMCSRTQKLMQKLFNR